VFEIYSNPKSVNIQKFVQKSNSFAICAKICATKNRKTKEKPERSTGPAHV
jgi:hypothetical protein